ncbi:hypothetical protein TNIN_180781, partial [Trichonephila inaurata madagascariensis]
VIALVESQELQVWLRCE